jgi:hypothetical protein
MLIDAQADVTENPICETAPGQHPACGGDEGAQRSEFGHRGHRALSFVVNIAAVARSFENLSFPYCDPTVGQPLNVAERASAGKNSVITQNPVIIVVMR